MKKVSLTYLMVLFVGNLFAGNKCHSEEWTLRTDSVYIYKWDNATQEWVDPNIQINISDPATGLLKELWVKNIASSEFISKQIFKYNDEELRTVQQFMDWKDGVWINYRRNLTNYSDDDLVSDILIQYWKDDTWSSEIWQKNYTYNALNQLTYFEFYSWKNNQWILGRYDYWNYNEDDLLDYRLSTYTNGSYYYQIFYTYTDFNEWDVMTAQRWTENGWENYWRRTYEYDPCGNLVIQVEQRWENGEWRNRTRNEYFYSPVVSPNRHQRIPVCHNGHTIYLPASAVPAHLKHGDCLGKCAMDRKTGYGRSGSYMKHKRYVKNTKSGEHAYKSGSVESQDNESNDLSIYPNPFSDYLNVELGAQNKSLQNIELVDYTGKIVWEHRYVGEEFLHIPRNDLPNGIYLLRFNSDETITKKIFIQAR